MTGAEFLITHIGKPWAAGGEGPAAFDCWGLVRAFYRDVQGVALPVVDVDALDPRDVRAEFAAAANRAGWVEHAIHDGAAALMGKSGRPAHVGVWLGGRMLHCVQGAGVVHQSVLQLRLAGWNVLGTYARAGR